MIRVVTVWMGSGPKRSLEATHHVNAPDGTSAVWYVAGKRGMIYEEWHGKNPPYVLRDEGSLVDRVKSSLIHQ